MLSDQEKRDYLFNTVIPIYKPLLMANMRLGILDFDLRLCWITESLRRFLGVGKDITKEEHSYIDLPPSVIERFCSVNKISIEDFLVTAQKTVEIMRKVMEKKELAHFVILLPQIKTFQGFARTAIPIIHPSGEVVGVQVVGYFFSLFGIQEFINLLNGGEYSPKKFYPEPSNNEFYNNLKLSPRQKEVLFLVSQGISQDYAAQILGIKRGTLSKIITDQICPKFDIFPPHYIKLLETVRKEGLDQYIPQTFWRSHVLEFKTA